MSIYNIQKDKQYYGCPICEPQKTQYFSLIINVYILNFHSVKFNYDIASTV
jgi:hypothetical protein